MYQSSHGVNDRSSSVIGYWKVAYTICICICNIVDGFLSSAHVVKCSYIKCQVLNQIHVQIHSLCYFIFRQDKFVSINSDRMHGR